MICAPSPAKPIPSLAAPIRRSVSEARHFLCHALYSAELAACREISAVMHGCWFGGSGGRYCDREVVLCAGRFNAGKAPGTGRCAAPGCGAGSGCYCQRSGSLARICADCPVVMVSIQVAVRLSGGSSSTRSGAWPVPPRPRVRVVCQLPSLSRIQVTGQAGSSSGQQLAGHFGPLACRCMMVRPWQLCRPRMARLIPSSSGG